MKFKKCHLCRKSFPLFMFRKDNMKYQIPSDYRRCKVCRICRWVKINKEGNFVEYNFITNKFEVIQVKSKFQILKQILK